MKALCFVPDANRPGYKDVSGAFLPEAARFCKVHGVDATLHLRTFSASGPTRERRRQVSEAISAHGPMDTIAFFCHGFRRGIQAGFMLAHIPDLAHLLQQHMHHASPRVILYACDAARDLDLERDDDRDVGPGGDGGFADELRDQCENNGFPLQVTAHSTRGHTTINPYVRRFVVGTGQKGGYWVIAPRSKYWYRWRQALRARDDTLRYRFPFMSRAAIAHELAPPPSDPPPDVA